ncbi:MULTISPECIES: hypothetical protein [Halolamina]|uniref:DUF8054 domain-containing protein n=1 Tax=Halolamina pelagica TaxID=699431 RepID=A0A1I5SFZ7_9EURY|nr:MULTISPECIES: hypothetical protein [Halolamina]NHX37077.1 hypothetical protein [Halolamina sp. R1-12]SFP69641.1 hypothetical protein SAMN05216277_106100 [Halolamina pelagica]
MNGPGATDLEIPRGRLIRSRVGVASALDAAFSRELTGYARIEPDSLLADGEPGVVTFAEGVPRAAYCERGTGDGERRGDSHEPERPIGGDSRGVDALAALAGPGPCSVELYELPADALAEVHDAPEFSVPPGAPAEELADDPALAERTRDRAPADAHDGEASALESFLEDEERIAAIQEEARAEAEQRAAEWGLDDQLE